MECGTSYRTNDSIIRCQQVNNNSRAHVRGVARTQPIAIVGLEQLV